MSLYQLVRGDDLVLHAALTEDGSSVDTSTISDAWFTLRTALTGGSEIWSGSITAGEVVRGAGLLEITIPDTATTGFPDPSSSSVSDSETNLPTVTTYAFLKVKKADGTLSHAVKAAKLLFVDSPLRTQT